MRTQASVTSEGEAKPLTNAQFEAILVTKMNEMLDEAHERGMLPVFANVTTWKLAVLAHQCGQYVAGDIQRLYGQHLCALAEQESAARESKASRQAGHEPH